ncbi:MAG: tRNA (5-methylaminomethyl-2-thiouridine)(34)-methyltransferase MnmD [Bacteroidales bacterium]|nr:tRNA (5-methylaminomethyl-2-thiouridine)(34)-methyltransferase MnmD [Bacteroidales bacterium]
MNIKCITTKDGSHTLHVTDLNENYHSVAGAITESRHIFIDHGLLQSGANPIKVFEIGFGTGLNALLARKVSEINHKTIHYASIEKEPLPFNLIQELNYTEILKISKEYFFQLHNTEWDKTVKLNEHFYLKKIHKNWIEYIPDFTCDVVFYDAFAPDFQPEMWSDKLLKKIFDCMNHQGILTTYTVKGSVKRGLQNAGFTIEKIKGPAGGKRENLIARKL